MSDINTLLTLHDELIALCESKGLTGEEIFIIGAMVDDQEAADKFGEVMAIKMVIEAIKLCSNDSEQIFYVVEKVLGIR